MKKRSHRLRRGQTMLFLIMVVVILAFVALWNFDLHKGLYVKSLTRNAGDGAALAAARWQGITLNILGELNAAQAVAINDALLRGDTNFAEARAIAALQGQVRYAGPMIGLAAAQQVAKNNRVFVNGTFTHSVLSHAHIARVDQQLTDYATMAEAVASEGIVALPGSYAYHVLLDPKFYDAVRWEMWCWFYRGHMYLLNNCTHDDLPKLTFREFLSVNVTTLPYLAALAGFMGDATLPAKVLKQLSDVAGRSLVSDVTLVPATWYCYDGSWTNWTAYVNGLQEGGPYPFTSSIKTKYDVVGAATSLRVCATSNPSYFNKSVHHVTYVSAAKPFGYLDGDLSASAYHVVLPAFRDVRLVPVDSAGISPPPDIDNGDADSGTGSIPENHYKHVYDYLYNGAASLEPNCSHCKLIVKWDPQFTDFQQRGSALLRTAWTTNCPTSAPGGGGGGGGSAHGH
jgi:hypothetical protein